jgi:5-methylcytosine-specific restriction protein A
MTFSSIYSLEGLRMRKVTKTACTKITGCPAYSCDDETCLGKNIKTHKSARVQSAVGIEHNHKWYYAKRWKTIRAGQLSRQPLCQRCLFFGFITAGHHVDHVIAHEGEATLFFDKDNLQSLCLSCHSTKTASERKGIILDYRSGEEVKTAI